ncbi:MAG: hypothetical protein GY713_23405 [Actinomycetia bacterium]|nr:hypothetical protein [Actinomycetes bacterium]
MEPRTRCGCEYEWGVLVAFFAERIALGRDQIVSLTQGSADDPCWTTQRDRLLIRAVDELHDSAALTDALFAELAEDFSEAQLLDLFMLAGWYHPISFAANGA